MKIVIAMDSFKGSLSSLAAGEAVRAGIARAFPEAETEVFPLADGGEGTVAALANCHHGEIRRAEVHGPLGAPVTAEYAWWPDNDTAVVEVAAACGITLLDRAALDPCRTSTRGVGEILAAAIRDGARKFIIGLGGSATNDGGAGMLQALGFRFLDSARREIAPGGAGLGDLARIDISGAMPELQECEFLLASDVTAPLCGPTGASAVYGPQKGATPEQVALLDNNLRHFAQLSEKKLRLIGAEIPGAGAAGGLGYAFLVYLRARLLPGAGIVMEKTGLTERLVEADLVITGEGRLDAQTVTGKAPAEVAALADQHRIPVLAFSGCAAPDAGVCNEHGITAFFPALRSVVPLDEALNPATAAANLTATAEQVFRLIKAYGGNYTPPPKESNGYDQHRTFMEIILVCPHCKTAFARTVKPFLNYPDGMYQMPCPKCGTRFRLAAKPVSNLPDDLPVAYVQFLDTGINKSYWSDRVEMDSAWRAMLEQNLLNSFPKSFGEPLHDWATQEIPHAALIIISIIVGTILFLAFLTFSNIRPF